MHLPIDNFLFRSQLVNLRGWALLLVFMLTQIVYMTMLLVTLPQLMEFSGGLKPFDLMPAGYDINYAIQFIRALGVEGEDYYLTRQIPLDMIYPGLFAITYTSLWQLLITKTRIKAPYLRLMAWLPLVAAFFDYAENVIVIKMLFSFPDLTGLLVTLANCSTVTKSVATSVYLIALLFLLIFYGMKRLRKTHE